MWAVGADHDHSDTMAADPPVGVPVSTEAIAMEADTEQSVRVGLTSTWLTR
jgi:hypothetical protein